MSGKVLARWCRLWQAPPFGCVAGRIMGGVYASMLTPEQERELRGLRARAYGPTADIGADPIALARLRELESLGHLEIDAPLEPAPAPDEGGARTDPPETVQRRGEADVGGDANRPGEGRAPAALVEAPAPFARTRAWVRAVSPGAWVVAAGAVLVVAAVAWGVAQLTAPASDRALAELETDEVPPAILGDNYFSTLYGVTTEGMRMHESFRTVTPWSWTGADGTRCLLLTVEGFERIIDGACTPPGLDPITHITVWPGLSGELVGDLPQGSVIRFELHDRRVHVWVRAANERS